GAKVRCLRHLAKFRVPTRRSRLRRWHADQYRDDANDDQHARTSNHVASSCQPILLRALSGCVLRRVRGLDPMKSSRNRALPPVVSILLSVFSVQGGAAIAKGLFPVIGPAGTAAVRIGLSAIILLAIFRPPVHRFTAAQWRAVVPYGVSIGVMNLVFDQALVRIPLGLAVTLEFVGPLAVAIVGSRRALDGVWVALAAIGIALIAPWQAGSAAGTIDALGVAIALLTGGCWAVYIVLGGRVSRLLSGGAAVATGMSIATLTVLPFAIAGGGLVGFV